MASAVHSQTITQGTQPVKPQSTGSSYLGKIYSLPSDKVEGKSFEKLCKEIIKEYGEEVAKNTNSYLFGLSETESDTVAQFKARITESYVSNSKLSGSDVKYIAEIARRKSIGNL